MFFSHFVSLSRSKSSWEKFEDDERRATTPSFREGINGRRKLKEFIRILA